MFEKIFTTELAAITIDTSLIQTLLLEVRKEYGRRNRFYHTLNHLDHMVAELMAVQDRITDWQALVFAVAYHDIVYDPSGMDNEERSALLANKRLGRLGLHEEQIKKCTLLILATKDHVPSWHQDTNYFTDADLAILGSEQATYRQYAWNIREEYRLYPDFMYMPGRRKALQHFLEMETIYKTEHFREKYEQQARQNLLDELNVLS